MSTRARCKPCSRIFPPRSRCSGTGRIPRFSPAVAGRAVFPLRAARFWRRVPALSRAGCADEQFLSAAFRADIALCSAVPKSDGGRPHSIAASANGLSLPAAQRARIVSRRGGKAKAQDERGDSGGNRSFHGHLLRTDVSVPPDRIDFPRLQNGARVRIGFLSEVPFGLRKSLASSQFLVYRQCG